MKKILSSAFVGAALLALAACGDDTETRLADAPVVTLSPSSVTLSSEAVSSYPLSYSVSSPQDGASVSASADASWVSVIDTSVSGQVRLSVAENASGELRSATLTLTYSYDDGHASAKAAIVQYGAGDAALAVDPNAVVADAAGGAYSFGYDINNPIDGEDVSCSTTADWISGFDYSSYGKVSFTVAANDGEGLRTGTIAVSYAGLSKEVTVVQDHPGSSDSGSGGDTGTWNYYGTGDYYYTGLYFSGKSTSLTIYQNSDNPNRFKIANWAYGMDFLFTWNQTTNVITVDEGQYTGTDYDIYGAVNVRDMQVQLSDYLYYSTYGYCENGVFYFALEYYCSGGMFGFGFETFVLNTGNVGVSLSEISGSYGVFEVDGYSGYAWYGEYIMAASDDASKGNIMFTTTFDDFDCSQGNIYGNYDEETGIAEFECDQFFGYNDSYYLAASLYYSYEYFPITFLFFNDGSFWGPFYGDYMTIDAYEQYYGTYMYAGFYYAYEYLYGVNGLDVSGNAVQSAVGGVNSRPERSEPIARDRSNKSAALAGSHATRFASPKIKIDSVAR